MSTPSSPRLRMFFLPFVAYGHMIPALDLAKLIATRGVEMTIITTPRCATLFSDRIQRSKSLGIPINIRTLMLPYDELGFPEMFDSFDVFREKIFNDDTKFVRFLYAIKEPVEQLLQECKPDCLIADFLFPWATESAAKFGIPRLVFHFTNFFSLCVSLCLGLYEPHKKVQSDSDVFLLPNLPGNIKFTRNHLTEGGYTDLLIAFREAEKRSYGALVNSFYEIEATYVDHYKNFFGIRAWDVGPVSLCNQAIEDKADRGKRATVGEHECLKWLNSKKPNSVVLICFGSLAHFTSAQLKEIAVGLEASEQQFIWVVGKDRNDEEEKEWLPEGFEKRMKAKGIIIRGWAPQLLILDHEAVGGLVTHCSWNSILEAICAGVTMVTWPLAHDHTYNEKIVTDFLKIGVAVGVQKAVLWEGDFVKRESIEKAVKEIMVGEKAEEMRRRVKELGEKARKAVQKGGSSYSNLDALIEELTLRRTE